MSEVTEQTKLRNVIRHIQGVSENCNELAFRLSERGEQDFARRLIANGLIHDNSKLSGIEWECLHSGEEKKLFDEALHHHVTTNMHHSEFWGKEGVHDMPRIYIGEMVADWKQRSSEFGTDFNEWVTEVATKKYNFDFRSKAGKEIKDFVSLILDKSFA